MKKILFPTDFSDVSRNAFIYALKLAENLGAEVITLHVYDLPTLSAGGMPNTIKEVYDSIELENFENFKDEIPFLRKIAEENNLGHISVSNVLKHGDFVWTLNHVAKDENIDLIVMGTEGASGLKEVFVGSMSGSVLVESKSNVLIVPKKGSFKTIKHIGFTTRFRDKDISALKDVLQIAHGFQAKVHCLYVKTGHSDVSEETIKQWKENFKDDNLKFQIIENNNIKDSILVFTELEKIDLLALVTYKRGFFQELFDQSLAQKLSYHVKVPLLAIKEE
jgi:nucleotide-binding universal stress UspA family protein